LGKTIAGTLHRSADDFSSRLEQVDNLSRKRAENQSERELATAPIGAGTENRAVRAAARQPNIATQLDQLGAAVEQFNAEFELQLEGNPAAGNKSRTESSTARPDNSRGVGRHRCTHCCGYSKFLRGQLAR